jgi:signal transduction histidine kinase/DNA-binding response OmpR family regulator
MRIVIVEDHAMIRDILVFALRNTVDYQVEGCSTAQAGMAACLNGADLAVFDHRLPDMTGTEAVTLLRADNRTKHLPIIVVTGEDDTATKMNAIRAGATEFLTKPVNIDEFKLRVRNLLDLHQARKTADDRGDLLETLIASSDAAIAVADARKPSLDLLYVSKALESMLALETTHLDGRNAEMLVSMAEHGTEYDLLMQALRDRQAGRFVLRLAPALGQPFWNAITLQPVPEPGPKARFLVISHQNVSDMVEMRADLNRVEGRLSDIARISGAWFFEIDPNLCLSYVSDAMARALFVEPNELLGRHIDTLDAKLGTRHTRTNNTLSAVLQSSQSARVEELLTVRRPDGTNLSVQISLAAFNDEAGEFAGYRGYAGDVSALAAARDQLEHANRAKSAFLATMSHEMRTPLTAILGMADLLGKSDHASALAEHLGQITAAAHELTEVLGDVLDVARLDDGPMQLNPMPFDLAATWRNVIATHATLAAEKGIVLDVQLTGNSPEPRLGDANCLSQTLRHLLSNAVKFTAQGTIRATLDLRDRERVVIEIADTGIGMPANQVERAFEPFCQLDNGMARQFGGRGVGLSIARWLVQSMQGSLTLQSELGQGTIATLILPLPVAEPRDTTGLSLDLTGRKVLVTDDSAANRRLLELMLRKMKANVTLCEDGPAALEAWAVQPFDLFLFDINMPQMAGTELIREIRKREAQAHLPPVKALAVTANAMPDQVRDYLAAGFDGCLSKPFTSDRLQAMIHQVT